jgi:hypothetical protein
VAEDASRIAHPPSSPFLILNFAFLIFSVPGLPLRGKCSIGSIVSIASIKIFLQKMPEKGRLPSAAAIGPDFQPHSAGSDSPCRRRRKESGSSRPGPFEEGGARRRN